MTINDMDYFERHDIKSDSLKRVTWIITKSLLPTEGHHCNRLFGLRTYPTRKILRWSILTFWVYKYYAKCWVCHKTAINIVGLRQTQEFRSGFTQILFVSKYFGSDLDTP